MKTPYSFRRLTLVLLTGLLPHLPMPAPAQTLTLPARSTGPYNVKSCTFTHNLPVGCAIYPLPEASVVRAAGASSCQTMRWRGDYRAVGRS
ncbi:hypothetical protein [Hymenobacter weizhouensis]|uniref:hypothetical protein n=1 Tax=Hymenobacter sp. YIM 151500-1 TaxID=2987689 RepID=UPI00222724BB|nr:hypothetical protein [Hymenobacter sp. YIM 151500-1]UYZ63854.1 hypothetical protein OIS53_03185 [Hymenobacter sp. YIM 151500-1]